jgi:hypothetical protein
MAGSANTMPQSFRNLWSVLTGQSAAAAPDVVLHDPAAQRAHNLDDPFYDDKVQTRIADVIASTGNRKTKNSY